MDPIVLGALINVFGPVLVSFIVWMTAQANRHAIERASANTTILAAETKVAAFEAVTATKIAAAENKLIALETKTAIEKTNATLEKTHELVNSGMKQLLTVSIAAAEERGKISGAAAAAAAAGQIMVEPLIAR